MSEINIPERHDYNTITPFRLFVKSNFPFIESTYEALDNYGLYCKVVEYLNQVIAEQNDVSADMITFTDFVTNYFENLDVTEEINDKLDEMATTGVLQNIVANIFTSLQNQIDSVASGSPAGTYATINDLQTADPDHSKIYVVVSDGYWYYYNTSTSNWSRGGVYQSTVDLSLVNVNDMSLNILIDNPVNVTGFVNNAGVLQPIAAFRSTNHIKVFTKSIYIYGLLSGLNDEFYYVHCFDSNDVHLGGVSVSEIDTTNHIYLAELIDKTAYITITNGQAYANGLKAYSDLGNFTLENLLANYVSYDNTAINTEYCTENNITSVKNIPVNKVMRVSANMMSVISDLPTNTTGTIVKLSPSGSNPYCIYIYVDINRTYYISYGTGESSIASWTQLLASDKSTSVLMGYDAYVSNQYCIDNNITSIKDFPNSKIIALGGNITSEQVPDLPIYGKLSTLIKFNPYEVTGARPDHNQFCIYLFSTIENQSYLCFGNGTNTTTAWKKILDSSDIASFDTEFQGFAGFKKFGVIGDSLSVGHMNTANGTAYPRNIYYSWPQYLARYLSNTALNFGFSGATCKTWYTDATHGYVELSEPNNLCQCYIVGIGVNDTESTGSISDIDWSDRTNNADTFYGNYAKILQAINEKAPNAIIFTLTIPYPRIDNAKNNAIREISNNENLNNVVLVDLAQNYNSYFTNENVSNFINQSHYTASGYSNISKSMNTILNNVMRNNADKFIDIFTIPYGNNDVIS